MRERRFIERRQDWEQRQPAPAARSYLLSVPPGVGGPGHTRVRSQARLLSHCVSASVSAPGWG